MSIPVDVTRLKETLADFGAGYLLTVSAQDRVKVLTVDAHVVDGVLVLSGPSGGTAANIAAHAAVAVVFPPREPKGFSLIVDGTARVVGDDFEVAPDSAVLHRPAAHHPH